MALYMKGAGKVRLARKSNNLIRFPYTCFKNANTFEKNGVTFTQLDDGGIKIQGTVTEGINFFAINLDSMVLGADLNIYTAWGTHSKNGYTVSYNNGIVDVEKQPNGERIMIAYTGGNKLVWLRCYGNQTCDYVVYPMLNKGPAPLPYEQGSKPVYLQLKIKEK